MAGLKKSELTFKDYAWKAKNDDSKKRGKNDRAQVNRKQGYEVLYFVNRFMEKYMLTEVASGQKVERMLRTDVPSRLRKREKIEAWIVENWG